MVERASLLAVAVLAAGCGGERMEAGLLESVCADQYDYESYASVPGCSVTGDAQPTSGITATDLGFRFGPAGGSLFIRLIGIPKVSSGSPWSLDALAASTSGAPAVLERALAWGTCGIYCPPSVPEGAFDVGGDAVWVDLAHNLQGYNPNSSPPTDGVLRIDARDVDLFELRTPPDQP